MASRRDAQRLRHRAFAQTQAFTQTRAERPRLSLRLHPTQAERPFLARWAEADASRAERAAGTALIQQRMWLLWVEQFLPDTAVPRTFSSAEWKRKFHGEYTQQDTAGQASQLVS